MGLHKPSCLWVWGSGSLRTSIKLLTGPIFEVSCRILKNKNFLEPQCAVTVSFLFTTAKTQLLQDDQRGFMPASSLSPLEPVILGHSPVSDRAPPGWPDCWPGRFGLGPWFLAGRRPPEDGRDGVPDPLKKEESGGSPDRQVSSYVVHLRWSHIKAKLQSGP